MTKGFIIISIVFISIFYFHSNNYGQKIRIISINVRYDSKNDIEHAWDFRKDNIVSFLKKHDPDFIGLQEAQIHQLEFLLNKLEKYDYIGVSREDGIKKGDFNAILYKKSKYKVIDQQTFWLSNTPDFVSKGWDAKYFRICTFGKFMHKKNKKEIYIFNTHFDNFGEQSRINSAKLLIHKINNMNISNYPIVLMGDFNASPESKTISIITTELEDGLESSKKSNKGPIGTHNGLKVKKITNRIDYIFVKNLNVLDYQHIDTYPQLNSFLSDHLPVFIKIDL